MRIPVCVVRFICSICPSDDSWYTGHQAAEGGGFDEDNAEEDDSVNTLYEEIEEDASLKVAHFNGEKINLSMYFRTSQFSAEHVHQIVLESPIDGWQVSY